MVGSVQEWLQFEKILENGIIKTKDKNYVKIIKVKPINFNLKSELEKKAILNSYKIFLKSCNFDIQILIKSKKQSLKEHIENINKNKQKENEKIKNIINKYIENIKLINSKNKSDAKHFFILIKEIQEKNNEENCIEQLNEKYFKIKELLSKCGNTIININSQCEVEKILEEFIYLKIN